MPWHTPCQIRDEEHNDDDDGDVGHDHFLIWSLLDVLLEALKVDAFKQIHSIVLDGVSCQ